MNNKMFFLSVAALISFNTVAYSFTIVTQSSDANLDDPEFGTFRNGIQIVNQIPEFGPIIFVEDEGVGVTLSGNMGDEVTPHTTVIVPLEIKSVRSSTINGNGFIAIDVGTHGEVTLSPDIILQNAQLHVKDGSIVFKTEQNFNQLELNTVLQEGLLVFHEQVGTAKFSSPILASGNSSIETRQGVVLTVASEIQSTETLIKTGEGTLILEGNNNIANQLRLDQGATVIKAGSVLGDAEILIGDGAIFGISKDVTISNQIQIVENGIGTIFVPEGLGSVTGIISGSAGPLKKIGGGALVLYGANTYSGGTDLSEGYIIPVHEESLGTGTLVVNGHTALILYANISNDIDQKQKFVVIVPTEREASLNGIIIGSGGPLIKDGAGTLVLTDEVIENEGISVDLGTLIIESQVASTVTVGSKGFLGGAGYIAGDVRSEGAVYGTLHFTGNLAIANQGILKPGNSCGEIEILNDLTLETGSTLQIDFSDTCNSSLKVKETVMIEEGVNLVLNPLEGFNRRQDSFIFLKANQINAPTGFGTVTTGSLLFSGQVTFNPETIGVTISMVPFANLIAPSNAERVGDAIFEVTSQGSDVLIPIIKSLAALPTIESITAALNQMQPALYKGLALSQENNIVKVQQVLSDRIFYDLDSKTCSFVGGKPCSKKDFNVHFWVGGFGDDLHQKSNVFANSQQFGYQNNTAGFATGVDVHFMNYFSAGAIGGYTDTEARWSLNQGSGSVNSGYAGLYVSAIGDLAYGNLSVIGGFSGYNGNRVIQYGSVFETAVSSHNGLQVLSHADTGLNFKFGGFAFRPFDAFDFIAQTEDAYVESGAGVYDLSVAKMHADMIRNELGMQFPICFCLGMSDWTVSPKVSWVREIRTNGRNSTSKFVNTDVEFTTTGYFPDRSLVSPGIVVSGITFDHRIVLQLYYNGVFGSLYSDHNYGGLIRFGF